MSGSDDSTCIYWNIRDGKKIIFNSHQNGVTSVDAVYSHGEITVATSSADSTVRLWRFNPETEASGEVHSFQVFDIARSGICFKVKLYAVHDVGMLLAYVTDDDKIHLFGENFSKCFERLETLIGHEDWVRGLDFATDETGDILLASSSQDSSIRLWRISPKPETRVVCDQNLLQVEERTFTFAGNKFLLSLESVLQGHENWVYSVDWRTNIDTNTLQLLSSSMDKTMIIWTFDKEQSLWTEKIRVGDVGGNSLGFYGAKFHSSGKSIVGHGFLGSLHLWHENAAEDRLWESGVINGGHFKEVKDIAWEPSGHFLLSTSVDQTTRIHACWSRNGKPATYHEIARPQVHGYDMQSLAVLSRYRFASAAEEKIVRTFQAPGNFVENLRNLVGVRNDEEGNEILKSHQKGASVPSLGLSNKAVYDDEIDTKAVNDRKFKDEYPENYFVPMTMTSPPTEEYLTQNTLWPEIQKLYAHGYELYSLAAARDGKILASACKATTSDHAEIILWDTKSWNIIQRMLSHKLTVTQMKFSSDGQRLLSVSRDRRWTVFENGSSEETNFEVAASSSRNNGIHERIIWTCCWTHDDKFFATGSRDGKVVAWTKANIKDEESSLGDYRAVDFSLNLRQSVTALAFAHTQVDGCYLLAAGLECGQIHLHKFNGSSFELLKTLNHSEAHHLAVNKLEFQPNLTADIRLASCGADHFVKIHEIRF